MKRCKEAGKPGELSVSIHTRHYWRVKRQPLVRQDVLVRVSIHTRHYWRVKLCP